MLKQVGNQNSNSLLQQATFGLFTKLSFVFVSNKTFCCGCFVPPSPAAPGATAPSAPPPFSYATDRANTMFKHRRHFTSRNSFSVVNEYVSYFIGLTLSQQVYSVDLHRVVAGSNNSILIC